MAQRHSSPDDALGRIECRDEILQLLYWLAGEGLETEMTSAGMARFMARPEDEIRPALDELVDLGLVDRAAGGDLDRYSLTGTGRREGGRRFVEEFAGVLGQEEHGACSDPDCDCHASPEAIGLCIHR